MDILVLSCGTGGGHNSAGGAVAEEMAKRGHTVTFRDVYDIVGENTSKLLNGTYIGMARNAPRLFGWIYSLGESLDRHSIDSPVYRINSKASKSLGDYLSANAFDAIVVSHMFASHMIKSLKNANKSVPKSVFLATDYTCSPFTGESDCDAYIIPHSSLKDEFVSQGIPEVRIRAFGIPVFLEFSSENNKPKERDVLGLDRDAYYYLLAGGSMGAGAVEESLETICDMAIPERRIGVTVICGSNRRLYDSLLQKHGKKTFVRIIGRTDKMASYMKASDVFVSKPGGLSSTEAAVVGMPIVHISPIPGCETRNAEFFYRHGLSLYAENPQKELKNVLERVLQKGAAEKMLINQQVCINRNATKDICDFIEKEL